MWQEIIVVNRKMSNIRFSAYYIKVNKADKERYLSKLSVLDNHDSYLLKGRDFTEDLAALPPLR